MKKVPGLQVVTTVDVPERPLPAEIHRLTRFFGTTERFWLNLQARYDIERECDRLADTLAAIEPLVRA